MGTCATSQPTAWLARHGRERRAVLLEAWGDMGLTAEHCHSDACGEAALGEAAAA